MLTPNKITSGMLDAADDYMRANTAYPYTDIEPRVKFCAVVNAAIDAGLVVIRNNGNDTTPQIVEALEAAIEYIPGSEVRSWPPGFRLRREAMQKCRDALRLLKGDGKP